MQLQRTLTVLNAIPDDKLEAFQAYAAEAIKSAELAPVSRVSG